MKRKKSILNRIVNVAIIAMCCYLAASCIVLFMDVVAYKNKIAEVYEQCEEQKLSNEEWDAWVKQSSDKEFVIKMARERLGLIFPDERVYYNASENK